ncbi:crossover junction endodeoxyribonuclease RuvC [Butyricicoccus sp. 1XD8-22]|nr:crossover junction endodeoxyribonuclease RuvC [Butyricicoccus sp. 1XD8-22]
MTILGIDPGYGIIGYGLVKYDGRQFTPVQFGAIRTEIGAPMPQRLCELYNDLNTLLETFHPEEAAVEELFFNQNITTGIQVAQARGVILLALAQRGLRPVSYTPSQVKMSVVGYGKAEKRQVMEMTRTLLGLKKVPHPDDAADALALAICHGHSLRADALR